MSLKDLWRPGWTARSRQCQGCSHCRTRERGQGSRQPCLDIDSGKFAAAHNRVHHGRILCCIVVLAEEVVLARQRNDTLPVLNKIGVDSVPAVDDITAQAVVVGDRIVDGLAYRTLGKDLGGLVLEPYFKRLKYGDRKTHAEIPALIACQVLVISLAFDLIQEADLFDGILRACRVIAHAAVEPATFIISMILSKERAQFLRNLLTSNCSFDNDC